MSGKFGALGRLSTMRPETQENGKAENEENRKLEIEETWVALGTEVQKTTKRRLKAYAGANGRKLKELVDEAITAHLDSLEN